MSENKEVKPDFFNRFTGRFQHWQVIMFFLMAYDAIMVMTSYFVAIWIRFDCRYSLIPTKYFYAYLYAAPAVIIVTILIFWFFQLYQSVWRFASYTELIRAVMANLLSAVFHIVFITVFYRRMPISYYVMGAAFQMALTIGIRFSYRFILLERNRRSAAHASRNNVMLIGAGAAGQMILRDVNQTMETDDRIVCIIDDNPNKWNRQIDGVPIVGGREDILLNVDKYHVNKIYFAIPTASAVDRRDILNICKEANCQLKQLPGMYQFVLGQVKVSAMSEVSVEDLLGREPIKTDMAGVYNFISGKTILVTGGGGSIGSELCRQIAKHDPKRLIIFYIYENNAYDIQLELKEKYPQLDLVVLIGSVRDSRRINSVFAKYRPEVVYHAAAHKHVPLMEDSPCEAIKNNAIGTYKTAYAAMTYGCKRFVLISTDKAVNPTNIMGASKRICEMIIQSFDARIKAGRASEIPPLYTHDSDYEEGEDSQFEFRFMPDSAATEFVAVRFGNVLGSNGSVIPIFKKQIEKGGPVTVTHPDIIRYFMTIPEAVNLVMEAGTYAKGGEIFVLDMGSPMKIDTLARNLIKLSGYKPDIDIPIVYTGLRPGEKLYEEKLMAEEGLETTQNEMIHIGKPIAFDVDQFFGELDELLKAAYMNREDIRELVEKVVKTYHPIKKQNGS